MVSRELKRSICNEGVASGDARSARGLKESQNRLQVYMEELQREPWYAKLDDKVARSLHQGIGGSLHTIT